MAHALFLQINRFGKSIPQQPAQPGCTLPAQMVQVQPVLSQVNPIRVQVQGVMHRLILVLIVLEATHTPQVYFYSFPYH